MALPVLQSGYSLVTTAGIASSITLTAPTGITSGDLLLLICMDDADNQGTTLFVAPAGFVSINSAQNGANDTTVNVFWKIAVGGETAITVDHSGVSDELMGWFVRVTGTDTTTPVHTVGVNAFGVGTSLLIPASTTTVAYCLAFYVQSFDGGDGFPFSVAGTGWAKQDEGQENTDGNTISGSFGTKGIVSSGSTGDATVTASVSDGMTAFQFSIQSPISLDATAPILTSATSLKTGKVTATGSVITDEDNGELYWYTSQSATPPSTIDHKAGTGSDAFGSQTVTAIGTENISVSGLSASTLYYHHYYHEDAVLNASNQITSPSFTTDAAATLALSGTVTASISEEDIIAGGKTIILTVTDNTWATSGANFDAVRQAIIDGLDGT